MTDQRESRKTERTTKSNAQTFRKINKRKKKRIRLGGRLRGQRRRLQMPLVRYVTGRREGRGGQLRKMKLSER